MYLLWLIAKQTNRKTIKPNTKCYIFNNTLKYLQKNLNLAGRQMIIPKHYVTNISKAYCN